MRGKVPATTEVAGVGRSGAGEGQRRLCQPLHTQLQDEPALRQAAA